MDPSPSSLFQQRLMLIAVWLGFLLATASASFREGDFIPTAQKIQVHQTRTHWHDLVGEHCPRFGMDATEFIPLPAPKKLSSKVDDYKIQLSFNGEQFITPWLLIFGHHAVEQPMIDVEITRSGDEIKHIHAQVYQLSDEYIERHHLIVQNFQNTSHWPKHILVNYQFINVNDVDINRGLYVLYLLGLVVTLIVGFNSVRGYRAKLLQFFQETVGEDDIGNGPRPAWVGPKAE